MRHLFRITTCLMLLLCGISACERQKGTLEKAGERADEVVDNVKEGENPLKKKGSFEKAGEAIDNTIRPDSH